MPKHLESEFNSVADAVEALPEWLAVPANLTGKLVISIDSTVVGFKIRNRRKATGLSLRSMAKAMGISPPHLSDLELGRRNWRPSRIASATTVIESAERKNENVRED